MSREYRHFYEDAVILLDSNQLRNSTNLGVEEIEPMILWIIE